MAIPTVQIEISNWQGLDRYSPETDTDPHYWYDVENMEFDQGGVTAKRRGTVTVATFTGTVDMIYDYQNQLGFTATTDRVRTVVVAGGTLHVVDDIGGTPVVDATFTATSALHYGVTDDVGVAYISNENGGIPKMLCYVNSTWIYQDATLAGPVSASTITATTGASLSGDFQAVYAYVDVWGNESPLSPDSAIVTLSDQALDVSVVASADPTIDYMKIYVLGPGMSEYQLSGTFSNTTSTYNHTIDMATLMAGDEPPTGLQACPSGKYVGMYEDMLLVGGDPDVPDTVWCSNKQFHRQWSNNIVRVVTGDGQPIVGFAKSFGRGIVVKSDSHHVLEGTHHTDFRVRDYIYRYGAVGQTAIALANDQEAWFSEDGLYLDAGGSPQEVSKPIREYLKTLDFRNIIMYQGVPRLTVENFKYYRQIFVTCREDIQAGPEENDTLLVWSYDRNTWTRWKYNAPRIMANLQNVDDYEYIFGGDASGRIFQYMPLNAQANDDVIAATTSITCYAETPWMHLPRIAGLPDWELSRTIPRYIKIYASGEPAAGDNEVDLQCIYYVDFDKDTVIATFDITFTAHDWPTVRPYQKTIYYGGSVGTFNWIKWKFLNAEAGQHIKIHKIVHGFKPKPAVD